MDQQNTTPTTTRAWHDDRVVVHCGESLRDEIEQFARWAASLDLPIRASQNALLAQSIRLGMVLLRQRLEAFAAQEVQP